MANWKKKIMSGGAGDLHPGEEVLAGVFLNPFGFTSKLVAREVGGVVGRALAERGGRPGIDDADGMAARLPVDRIWIGLTSTRLLVWGHSNLSGKPKGLKATMASTDLVTVELDKLKTVHATILRFADGSARLYEAPKLFNDTEAFAAHVNGA